MMEGSNEYALDHSRYRLKIAIINMMTAEEQEALIQEDRCPYPPEHLLGVPMGMHHCPLCGEMVIAGLPHPRQKDIEDALKDYHPPEISGDLEEGTEEIF